MRKYDAISTDDLGTEFSDRYKDMHNFRPRHVSFDDREALIDALEEMDRDWDRYMSSESGRAHLRAQGYAIDYEYGDRLNYRGVAYRVDFVWKDGGVAFAYHLQPIARTDVRAIKVLAKYLRDWEKDQEDCARAKYYGISLEQYRRGY